MNYKNVYEQIAEHLDEKLERDATDEEIASYMLELESNYYKGD